MTFVPVLGERRPIGFPKTIDVIGPTRGAAVGEFTKAAIEEILRRQTPCGMFVARAPGNLSLAEAIPGYVDGRDARCDDLRGEFLVGDAGDHSVGTPVCGQLEPIVLASRLEKENPIFPLSETGDTLDNTRAPAGGRPIRPALAAAG